MKRVFLIVIVLAVLVSCNRSGKGPVMAENPAIQEMAGSPGKITPEKVDVKVSKSEGTITIAELLKNRNDYNGKTVTISGKITKINKAILGKNWLHIQDGTDFKGAYDLTVTTSLEPAEGDVVTLTGKIVLDKDFGYGYFYDILMEDAVFSE
jgi:hypothetical protein